MPFPKFSGVRATRGPSCRTPFTASQSQRRANSRPPPPTVRQGSSTGRSPIRRSSAICLAGSRRASTVRYRRSSGRKSPWAASADRTATGRPPASRRALPLS